MANSTTAKIVFSFLWFGSGILYARLFLFSIRSFTDKMQPGGGSKVALHFIFGGLFRTVTMGILLYFALRMGPLYAILAVAGFTIANLTQVAKLSGKRKKNEKENENNNETGN
mgnify:CR=1 FL=1